MFYNSSIVLVHFPNWTLKGNFPIGSDSIPETTYRFENPIKGTWTLTISTSNPITGRKLTQLTEDAPHGAVIVWNMSPVRAFSHLNTYNLVSGNRVGLVTELTEKSRGVAGMFELPFWFTKWRFLRIPMWRF